MTGRARYRIVRPHRATGCAANQGRSAKLDGTSTARYLPTKTQKPEQSYSSKSTTSPYFLLIIRDARQGGAWLGLGGGVFAAEEGLKEGVDAGVEGGDIGVYFLAELGHVLAGVLVSGINRAPDGQADTQDGNDDGDGAGVHEAYPNT